MDALDAKYPFFATAREAVADAAVSLPELVAADAPAVERARERVERALMDGTVASESGAFPTESAYDTQAELLSYPIARILVSLLDSDPRSRSTPRPRPRPRSTGSARTSRPTTSCGRCRHRPSRWTTYSPSSTSWMRCDRNRSAPTRGPAAQPRQGPGPAPPPPPAATRNTTGSLWDRTSVSRRPRGAIRGGSSTARSPTARCASPVRSFWTRSKPLSKIGFGRVSRSSSRPAGIAAELESGVADLKRLLSERTYAGPVDVVAPDLFPPCMRNLIEKPSAARISLRRSRSR